MSSSRYTPEQRAALIALGEMDERARGIYRPSQLVERFEQQGFDRNQLGRALNDLEREGVAKSHIIFGGNENAYQLTRKGRDEYNAEKG